MGPPRQDHPVSYLASIIVDNAPRAMQLALTERRLLELITRQLMRVLTCNVLFHTCLPAEEVLDRSVDSHISKLRRKACDRVADLTYTMAFSQTPFGDVHERTLRTSQMSH